MSDEPDNIVLQQLELVRRQVSWIGEKLDRLVDDVDNLKTRMTAVELAVGGVNRASVAWTFG
jgi:hypothetical protein